MNILTSLKSLGSFVAEHTAKLYNALPASVRTLLHGKIAEANLTLPSVPGADKRQWVAEEMAKLTGIASGIWHGLVHLGVMELEAKAPASLQPYLQPVGDLLESAADQAGDSIILKSPFAAAPANVVPIASPAPLPATALTPAPLGLGELLPPLAAPSQPPLPLAPVG